MRTKFSLLLIALLACQTLIAQDYNYYKNGIDTSFVSTYLGYEKEITVTLPLDWQEDIEKVYPLIIIFDRQNQRSQKHIIHTIDYLSAADQIPASIIIGISSDSEKRINEARSSVINEKGKAHLTEQYLFEELIPFAETKYKASKFRVLIGHSWFGHFTTAMFAKNTHQLNAVIALDPFFGSKRISLTDSITQLNTQTFKHHKYYRYAIGKDYPEDLKRIEATAGSNTNPNISIQGSAYPMACHNVVPGLGIGRALYEIFEYWFSQQFAFFDLENQEADIFPQLKKNIENHYGIEIGFSLALLNGKGWGFFNEQQYEKAITTWERLLAQYPNFSEGYLNIIEAQNELKMDTSLVKKMFIENLRQSNFYTESEKEELLKEIKE